MSVATLNTRPTACHATLGTNCGQWSNGKALNQLCRSILVYTKGRTGQCWGTPGLCEGIQVKGILASCVRNRLMIKAKRSIIQLLNSSSKKLFQAEILLRTSKKYIQFSSIISLFLCFFSRSRTSQDQRKKPQRTQLLLCRSRNMHHAFLPQSSGGWWLWEGWNKRVCLKRWAAIGSRSQFANWILQNICGVLGCWLFKGSWLWWHFLYCCNNTPERATDSAKNLPLYKYVKNCEKNARMVVFCASLGFKH